jgi:outer membrane protein assembly factor BamC
VKNVHTIAKLGALAACLALGACSVLQGEKVDYKSAQKAPSLDVPPDLTQLMRDPRYQLPAGGTVSASSLQTATARPVGDGNTALAKAGDVRIERAGNQRWLVVDRPADQLWGPVRDFWNENGFVLTQDQQQLGIMETDWAENRAKIPQDIIRRTLGRVLDGLYSTSERDRFRTRLERTASGGTEIYISHRGMQEVYTQGGNRDFSTAWQPRPPDPELEAEFLRRLMVKLGLPQEQAAAAAATGATRQPTAQVATVGGQPVVQVAEGFDRAWRRVGLALDRTGFTVEDRDRSQGTYFVRYVPPNPDKKEPGFLGRLFTREKVEQPLKFRIAVRSQGESTTVSVLDDKGAPVATENAQRIVRVIADDLK